MITGAFRSLSLVYFTRSYALVSVEPCAFSMHNVWCWWYLQICPLQISFLMWLCPTEQNYSVVYRDGPYRYLLFPSGEGVRKWVPAYICHFLPDPLEKCWSWGFLVQNPAQAKSLSVEEASDKRVLFLRIFNWIVCCRKGVFLALYHLQSLQSLFSYCPVLFFFSLSLYTLIKKTDCKLVSY